MPALTERKTMKSFIGGLLLGALLGVLGVAGGQFYPDMHPNTRDAVLKHIAMMQESQWLQQQQEHLQQMLLPAKWRPPSSHGAGAGQGGGNRRRISKAH